MTTELIAMLGGGASGFLFKLIGTMVTSQQANVTNLIKAQRSADKSADAAARRTAEGGAWVRRFIVIVVMFGAIIAPYLLAYSGQGVTVGKEYNTLFGLLSGTTYETLHGYVILPEIRQTVLAIVGFYFGSSSVK
jgi:hypothetical protein|tara:strand:- start:584 stop:988 length:405 start_codon:yes stop_codon:yes gene_type:complete